MKRPIKQLYEPTNPDKYRANVTAGHQRHQEFVCIQTHTQ